MSERAPLNARIWAAAATIAAPALRLMLRRRLARGREVPGRLAERRGLSSTSRPHGRLLWLHAASVGESLSVLKLLTAQPADVSVLFTTGTVTSAHLLQARLAGLQPDRRVIHQFVPLDVPAWAERFLAHWQPDAACFVESELWPNLLAACRRRRIPMALVNARLSARSARGWARAPVLARHLLAGFTFISAQSEDDAARLRALGAPEIACWGNLKLAADPLPAEPAEIAQLAGLLAGRPVWLAASIHRSDDDIVAAAHAALLARHPSLLTVIAPRHPDRGAALATRLNAPRRSQGQPPPMHGGAWIADTIGEMGLLYRCIPIVLMGNGFGGGGQNPWEPAQLGCAIATGPDTSNFADAIARLHGAGALQVVGDAPDLIAWLDKMLSDPGALAAARAAAHQATGAGSDLPGRLARRLAELMPPA